jgi:hypothetical protein
MTVALLHPVRRIGCSRDALVTTFRSQFRKNRAQKANRMVKVGAGCNRES